MSTKIYTAWRVPIGRFNEFLNLIHNYMHNEAKKQLKQLMGAILPAKIEELMEKIYHEKGWSKEKTYPQFKEVRNWDEYIRFRYAIELCYKASKGKERDPFFDLDCSLNVWLNGRKAYIIPYGEGSKYAGFQIPDFAEDYEYWDNSDRPDEVSQRQWRSRADKWENVCFVDWNKNRLLHEVVNVKEDMGLYPLADGLLKQKENRFWALIGLGYEFLGENDDGEKKDERKN